ncbi:MAG: DUF1570 domain-containing protein [Planctomycetia bacterium]|nr:DUF1570 domain-containing protein [Planctomycetia bacterium]
MKSGLHLFFVRFIYWFHLKFQGRVVLSAIVSATRNDGKVKFYTISGINPFQAPSRILLLFLFLALFSLFWLSPTSGYALDTVIWKPTPDAEEITTVGRVLTVAQDRSLLIQDRTGEIHPVEAEMLVRATRNALEFVPMTQDELAETYLKRLPGGFQAWKTDHFIVFYKTSREYARWNGLLLERLYDAFETFWAKQGVTLTEPEFPLFCVVFPNSREYHAFADAQGEHVGRSVIAYYSFQTNRVTCYDLSGQNDGRNHETSGNRSGNSGNRSGDGGRRVNFTTFTREMVERPDAAKQIATIIHEATHQLAHNRGLAHRYGDVPLWYNEGIALFFESPNMKSERGWTGIGRPNPFWLPHFKRQIPTRPEGQLEQILTNDSLFQGNATVQDAYAESWALTWFLIRTRPKQYAEFCRKMGEKPILIWDSHEERLAEFENIFGPTEKLEKEFVRYIKIQKLK